MKIIDLISMRAEGEEMPKKIRIDHWCYNFEWIEHESNYYDKDNDIDLMSCLSMSKEELNYEVKVIEEDKKIEKLEVIGWNDCIHEVTHTEKKIFIEINKTQTKLNEIIDYLLEKEQ